MTMLLVRHAHAGERAGWRDDDRGRPLSAKGIEQARALVDVLADHPIDRVLSSPYTRCLQSVEPLAAARGLKVEPADVLAEGTGGEAVATLLAGLIEQDVALCTHGDVLQEALFWLGTQGVELGSDLRFQKSSTWVIETSAGAPTTARYLAPPKV